MNDSSPGRPTLATWVLLGLLLVAGVVVRMIAMPYMREPFPADASYYWDVARSLATGRGLTIGYLWMYDHGLPDKLPIPSHGYWMPGMSFYVAAWLKLLGTSWQAGQLAAVALSVPFMLLVWRLGREITGRDGPALLAVAIAAVDPTFVLTSITPNAAMLQGLLLAGSLLLLHYGLYRDPRWLWAAGLLAGLGHFSRNDAALIVPVSLLCFLGCRRGGDCRAQLKHALYWLVPYALVLAPWLLRNTLVFGTASPPDQWRLMFLPRYNDIFRADLSSITVPQWLASHQGLRGALRYDLFVVLRMAEWMVATGGNSLLLFAVPFLWARRPALGRPFLTLFGLLCLAYGFVVPEIAIGGGYTQAFTSVLPLLFVGAAAGVWRAGEWVAARRPRLSGAATAALLAVALLAHTVTRLGLTLTNASMQERTVPVIADQALLRAFFQAHPPASEPVLVNDPWSFHPLVGRPCYMAPTDGMAKISEVARRTGARYLVLTGVSRQSYYRGVQEAIDQGRIAVVRAMPTLAPYQGLQIIDLRSETVLTEARADTVRGVEAARRGDYPAAIAAFEAASRRVADYPDPRQAVAGNLARAHLDAGKRLEGEGRLRAALEQYARAEESAPPGFDTSEITARREALEKRVGQRAPPPPLIP